MSPSTSRNEEVIFSIVLDSWTLLFEAGSRISGCVFMHFHGTNEEICFESLCIYLKENINLPQGGEMTRNLTSCFFEKQILLTQTSETYDDVIYNLNQSNTVKVPFEIHLPDMLCASFNSKQIVVNHEIKVELNHLKLCGEFCDLSTTQPIEIREIVSLNNALDTPQTDSHQIDELKNEKSFESQLGTLQIVLNKHVYSFGDILSADIRFRSNETFSKGLLCLHLVQIVELENESSNSRWEHVVYKTRQLVFLAESGTFESRKSLPLIDPIILSQPSVTQNDSFRIKYIFRVILEFRKREILTGLMFRIERRKSYLCDLKRIYSNTDIPILPLNLTVSDLKTDGLQSYIPLKHCYENKRLLVKKGDLKNTNALLTIVTNSCQPYYQDDVIKGYVFLQLSSKTFQNVEFQNLFLLLVGMRRHANLDSSVKGEMFLYKRLNLKGVRKTSNGCPNVRLDKNFGFMISEFEFDLKKICLAVPPPTFDSEGFRICYELKADIFKLKIDNSDTCSLYTSLPVVIKERLSEIPRDLSVSGSRTSRYGRYAVSGKEISVWYTIDRPYYHHRDIIQIQLSIRNKTKHQLSVKLEFNQLIETYCPNIVSNNSPVNNTIIILSLPKSRLQTVENIFLEDILFHKQPSVESCKQLKVTYTLSALTTLQSNGKRIGELSLPVRVVRKYGHLNKQISREGCPLLPLTLEVYNKNNSFRLPEVLESFGQRNLLQTICSNSTTSRWTGWKFDSSPTVT